MKSTHPAQPELTCSRLATERKHQRYLTLLKLQKAIFSFYSGFFILTVSLYQVLTEHYPSAALCTPEKDHGIVTIQKKPYDSISTEWA